MFPLLDAHVHVVDNMKISTIGVIFRLYWQHIYEVKYVVSTVDATFSISFVQCLSAFLKSRPITTQYIIFQKPNHQNKSM